MKRIFIIALSIIGFACEDQIFPELNTNDPYLVVDAWITNESEPQTITITRTQDYFDVNAPQGVTGAEVTITDDNGRVFQFLPGSIAGQYIWSPADSTDRLGDPGTAFSLSISVGQTMIASNTVMGRVPEIDSVAFRFEPGDAFFPDAYFADFWARDPVGPGDAYWIKAWKNGEYLSKPGEISLAYDAGFTQGGNVDGLIFIQPIRDSINPFDQDENDEFLPPYEPGDSVYVEIHSISEDAFQFLNEVIIQTDREGGFGELFAEPLANVDSNMEIVGNTGEAVVIGFFNVAAVTGKGRRLDPNNLPGERE